MSMWAKENTASISRFLPAVYLQPSSVVRAMHSPTVKMSLSA